MRRKKKKVGEVKRDVGDIMIFDRCWLALSGNPEHQPPEKRTAQPGDAFEGTAFKLGVQNCQILNKVLVESQLFSCLWNNYHQWLADIELIQISGLFSSFLSQDYTLFHCSRANRGLKLPRNLPTPKNDHLHFYSLWLQQSYLHAFKPTQKWNAQMRREMGFKIVTKREDNKIFYFHIHGQSLRGNIIDCRCDD
jgi:hypothetical protein